MAKIPKYSEAERRIIDNAKEYARAIGSSNAYSIHLLFSLTSETDVLEYIDFKKLNVVELVLAVRKSAREQSSRKYLSKPNLSTSVVRTFSRAKIAAGAFGSQKEGISLLYALSQDNSSPAGRVLRRFGVDPTDILSFMTIKSGESTASERIQDPVASMIPHQTAAPVRVEERSGKLVQVSGGVDSIDADELDFDRWRAPVADSLAELLDSDLGPGTNHERLRRRLLALAAALAGTIDEVKANQFRLGYGIESLGDLVGVYRTAADDMPTLNAAVFADVNRLHIQLMLGLSKLVAWSRFQRDADADVLHEGTADPAAVGAALAEAEAVLSGDAAAPIVDPELPRSFRWIREAIADPKETTRRMVYGAVKSLENVGVFLGQLSLRTAKEAIENTAQQIGKRASAALLLALSGALLHLSGALPVAWPWLKPLLEAAAKVVGG